MRNTPSIIALAALPLALAACGLNVQSADLSNGHKYDLVSGSDNMTVATSGIIYNPNGEIVSEFHRIADHPAVSLGQSVITAGGIAGAAALRRPDEYNSSITGIGHGGSGGAGGAAGDSAASADNDNVNAQGQGQLQGQLQGQQQGQGQSSTSVSNAESESNANAGAAAISNSEASGGGDNCFPPGQCK